MSEETWKPVVGYEGYYEVSDFGRVRSLDRSSKRGLRKGQIKTPYPLDTGHLRVRLSFNSKSRAFLVHRLVLEAFVGPCPAGMEGCHDPDPDPANNRLANLRWDTRSSNQLDSVKHGRHRSARRTHCIRGHVLNGPNLVPSGAANGKRSCLACSRARSIARIHGEVPTPELFARYYDQIMKEAA